MLRSFATCPGFFFTTGAPEPRSFQRQLHTLHRGPRNLRWKACANRLNGLPKRGRCDTGLCALALVLRLCCEGPRSQGAGGGARAAYRAARPRQLLIGPVAALARHGHPSTHIRCAVS
eukprot:gene17756-biopygen827